MTSTATRTNTHNTRTEDTTTPLLPRITVPDPAHLTADRPAEARGVDRDRVKMLVATGARSGTDATLHIEHARFGDLTHYLRPGDVLVVNNSGTMPAQIDATRHTRRADGRDGPVVVHVAGRLPAYVRGDVAIELRSAPDASTAVLDASPGNRITLAGGPTLELIGPYPADPSSPTGTGNRLWRAKADADLGAHLTRHGRPIAYGYLDAAYPLSDYQTIFSTTPGSAEMASAGRPFTPELLARVVGTGIHVATITLHTGISSQEAGEVVAPEWFEVGEASAATINAARAVGGRVIAVGTTVTRALESAARGRAGQLRAASGWTNHLVTPQSPPRVVDGLITGWHDPQASHLLLVEAVAGYELGQRAYDAAHEAGYLWHEFGDSALFLP